MTNLTLSNVRPALRLLKRMAVRELFKTEIDQVWCFTKCVSIYEIRCRISVTLDLFRDCTSFLFSTVSMAGWLENN